MTPGTDAPVVGLPARVDRRLGLGPFPSARAALKFVTIVAVGALVAAAAGPIAWAPFLGGGFLLTAYRWDGKTLDERLGDLVRWQVRRRGLGARHRLPRRSPAEAGVARLPSGFRLGVLTSGGVPVSFLPPPDARALFGAYRELLRSLESGAVLRMSSEPVGDRAFRLPPTDDPSAGDRAARAGYDEMVRLLCRHRRRRRIDLVVWSSAAGTLGRDRLDAQLGAMADRLRALGLDPERRRGPGLVRTLAEMGWSVEAIE